MAAKDNNLGKVMQVTGGKSWMTLWVLGGVLAGVLAWSILGTLPERIEGPGIVQLDGGIQQITAEGEGRIEEVLVKVDQRVEPGQLIIRMRDIVRDSQTAAAQEQYEQAEQQHRETVNSATGQIQRLQQDRTRLERELLDLQGTRDNIKKNVPDVYTQADLDRAERTVSQKRSEIVGVDDQIGRWRNMISQSQTALGVARGRRDSMIKVSATVSEVRAKVGGKILAIHRRRSETVRAREPIANIETGSTLKITAYIAASNGKRVELGDEVRLEVKGFPPAQFGHLLGTVEFVEDLPIPAQLAERTIGKDVVTSPSYVVTIRPVPDPRTKSGFAWTDGRGPAEQIGTSTPVVAAVKVAERAPYTYVLPLDKQHRMAEAQRGPAGTPTKPGS